MDDEEEPDLFQCGRCKQMFTVLQKYLRHKAGKGCSLFQSKAASLSEANESQVCFSLNLTALSAREGRMEGTQKKKKKKIERKKKIFEKKNIKKKKI